jgi:predicted anti-sigma-YlaC factor YlaD
MKRCDEIRELISARLDGALDSAGEKRLSDHLATCASCREDLTALERTLQRLHALPPVTPPPELGAKIRASIRAAQPTNRSRILVFLSLPQTRVALAASLLVVVTTLGIRQMLSSPRPALDLPARHTPVAGVAAAPQTPPAPLAKTAPPAASGKPAAPAITAPAAALREQAVVTPFAEEKRQVENSRRGAPAARLFASTAPREAARKQQDAAGAAATTAEFESARDKVAAPPAAMNAAASVAAYRATAAGGGLLAGGAMMDAQKPDAAATLAQPAEAADGVAADKINVDYMAKAAVARSAPIAETPAPAVAAAAPARPATSAAAPRARMRSLATDSAVLQRRASDSYTLRTDKIADATAIVRRYAAKKAELDADGLRANDVVAAKQDASKDAAQPVTVDVTLAAADLPALLEELRRAGAQLVSQPVADLKIAAAAAPQAPAGARLMGAAAAPSAAPAAPMAAAATMPTAVEGASGFAAATPATVTVRFTFLPPAP